MIRSGEHDTSTTDEPVSVQSAVQTDGIPRDLDAVDSAALLSHRQPENSTCSKHTVVKTLNHKTTPSKRKTPPTIIPAHPLSRSRYTRQLLLPQISIPGHETLASARVLVVGLGGLGCPAALYLAAAGVGTIGLLDSDTVELSNLHRQILHREDSVGWTKVKSAIRGLKEINSEIQYHGYEEAFTPGNAVRIAQDYEIILDCTDNPQTRYLVSDVAVALGKTVVSAAAQRMEGQSMILNYPVGQGPCYRCIFPRAPKAEMVVSCEEVGVLGTAVGTMGVIMAGETIRVLVQVKTSASNDRRPSMLLYSAWGETMFRTVRMRGKRKGCCACGEVTDLKPDEEKITAARIERGDIDYVTFCGTREDIKLLGLEERVTARQFLDSISTIPTPSDQDQATTTTTTTPDLVSSSALLAAATNHLPLTIDVREQQEYALGTKIRNSINIPISSILRTSSAPTALETPGTDSLISLIHQSTSTSTSTSIPPSHPSTTQQEPPTPPQPQSLIFICQRGNDSQVAAKRLKDAVVSDGGESFRNTWIGDVRGGFDAVSREVEVEVE